MRVICGKFKGKRLLAPINDNVRPTTDRIKETIFNILVNKIEIEGTTVLDLFCGSGALGIEALSRGAVRAIFIDSSAGSIKLTRQNLTEMGKITIASTLQKMPPGVDVGTNEDQRRAEVFNTNFEVALKKLVGEKIDIIFIDPPYFDNLGERSINLIDKYDILAENGIIVYEHYGKNGLSIDAKRYIIDSRNFGSVSVSFIMKAVAN